MSSVSCATEALCRTRQPRSTTTSSSSARNARRLILEQAHRAHVGHIGSALSIVEILDVAFGELHDHDRLILSKGHAALALYVALHLNGRLSVDQLDTYCADGSLLGVHPEAHLPGIEFSTGSLGHGLSMGAGCALASQLRGSSDRTFVLISDAELNEGSCWEAIMFAAHHQLANLIAIVDCNRQQALGYTRDVLDLTPLAAKWRAFGWYAQEVMGHDVRALDRAVYRHTGQPRVILANTTFGKGVSFMESQVAWHYLPMSEAQFAAAISEVTG